MARFKRIARLLAIGIFALLLLFFLFRNILLRYAFDKVAGKLKARTGCVVGASQKEFSGFATVHLNDVLVLAPQNDTLLFIDEISVRPSLLPFIVGRVQINRLSVEHALLNLRCQNGQCNYSGWINSRKDSAETDAEQKTSTGGLGRKFRSLIIRIFDLAPQEADLRDLKLQLRSDTLNADLAVTEFIASEDELYGTLVDYSTGGSWKIKGGFHQRKRAFDVTVFPIAGKKHLPLLQPMYGAAIGFDSLHLVLNGLEGSRSEAKLQGMFDMEGAYGYHPKIATDTVRLNHARFDYSVSIDENSIMLDSSSFAEVNRLTIKPFVKYDKSDAPVYSLKIAIDSTAANDFFGSLPEGMFDEVRSLRADGYLKFVLNFELNTANPDSVIFDCSMKRMGFRIRDFGNTGIPKINGEFIHDVYEKDRLVRSFSVGPSNPDYTPLDQVSIYFRNAVLTSEDGSFFYHNGFNEEAFRKSIAANYRAGKFVRGGSTITMQLVKNVFLTRKKTVARKAEEALIVWLIESNRLVAK